MASILQVPVKLENNVRILEGPLSVFSSAEKSQVVERRCRNDHEKNLSEFIIIEMSEELKEDFRI